MSQLEIKGQVTIRHVCCIVFESMLTMMRQSAERLLQPAWLHLEIKSHMTIFHVHPKACPLLDFVWKVVGVFKVFEEWYC